MDQRSLLKLQENWIGKATNLGHYLPRKKLDFSATMRYMDYKRYQIKADQVTVCKWQGDAGEVMVFGREENIPMLGFFFFTH